MEKSTATFCHICPAHCSRKITVEDGRIIDVDRDTESGFPSEWCSFTRGRIIKEVNTHPDRIKYPLMRTGNRGEGKWKKVPWDEVLDHIAGKIQEYKSNHGPESVAICIGEPKGMETAFAQRFASAFGTPNVATPGNY